ncbi:MAG: hypothetical protein U0935_19100 [Pirellulales bacterium]
MLLDVSGFFGDADATDTLSFSTAARCRRGCRLDRVTGSSADARQQAARPVACTAGRSRRTTATAGQATQTFTWVV